MTTTEIETTNDFTDFFMTEEQVAANAKKSAECDAIEAANVRKFGIFVEFPVISDREGSDQYPHFGSDFP
jgi:hypothetical protein